MNSAILPAAIKPVTGTRRGGRDTFAVRFKTEVFDKLGLEIGRYLILCGHLMHYWINPLFIVFGMDGWRKITERSNLIFPGIRGISFHNFFNAPESSSVVVNYCHQENEVSLEKYMYQFTSQVFPLSTEKDCCQVGVSGFVLSQRNSTRTGRPLC